MPVEDAQPKNWLDDLLDHVETTVNKVSKFKTHKLRKEYIGQLKKDIRTAIELNTTPVKSGNNNRNRDMITHPNTNKEVGYAVMTSRDSSKGDDLLGVGPHAQPEPPRPNKPVNQW